jgi:hypothetical protein
MTPTPARRFGLRRDRSFLPVSYFVSGGLISLLCDRRVRGVYGPTAAKDCQKFPFLLDDKGSF